MSQPNLIDLIRSRKWDRAIFTTYAISLSFFESNILRALREQGCREVWILCDADGYRTSLIERRSARVGIEYHLIPVGLPNGVFHPKCAYLAGPDGDVLTVGSGNLTYGGLGKNLEVIQILLPETQPEAFADFADFLDSLAASSKVKIGDLSWLQVFTDRARSTSNGPPTLSPMRLIHSIDVPIIDQLKAALPVLGASTEVWLLSPFHDPSAKTAIELMSTLKADKMHILVPPRESEFTFPFDKFPLPSKVDAVSVNLDDTRPIHAKWITLRTGERRLSLTGSVNATHAALCSTNNVEVAILYPHAEQSELEHATPADRPVFKPIKIEGPIGLKAGGVLHAAVDADGRINGSILSGENIEGAWTAWLMLPSGHEFEFIVNVESNGSFASQLMLPREFFMATGIQLLINVADEAVRGWVHNIDLLSLSYAGRLGASALSRFYGSHDTQADDVEILKYLADSMAQHRDLFDAAVVQDENATPSESKESQDYDVATFRLMPLVEPMPSPIEGLHGAHGASSLDRFLNRLRIAFVGDHRKSSAQAQSAEGRENVSAEDQDDDKGSAKKRGPEEPDNTVGQALEYFENAAMELLSSHKQDPKAQRQILTMLFEVGIKFRLHRSAEASDIWKFVREWRSLALLAGRLPPHLSAFEQYICIAIVCIAHQDGGKHARAVPWAASDFEDVYGATPDQKRCLETLSSAMNLPLMKDLAGPMANEVHILAKKILNTESERSQLARAYDAWITGKPIPSGLAVFGASGGNALRQAFDSNPATKSPMICNVSASETACPKCCFMLGIDEINRLTSDRYCECLHCHRFLIAARYDA